MYYSMADYDLIAFEKSHLPKKKYNAILANKKTGREVRIPFGAKNYYQYEDSTGLNLYKKFNHYDPERRRRFQKRHEGFLRKGMYSPSYFSFFYLW
jgi:hypothetical protein